MTGDYEIEIDESTFSMLSAIVNADEDPQSLASLANIDPEEFRKFLSECGETDNEDALELLAAALESHESKDAQLLMQSQVRDGAKTLFAIGDRVEQMCITCGEERGHIVASVTKKGKITRVSCPVCGSRVPYRSRTMHRASIKFGAPYDRARTYRPGQTLLHPTFGAGEVTAVDSEKIDVLFSDRVRRLIHSTPGALYESE